VHGRSARTILTLAIAFVGSPLQFAVAQGRPDDPAFGGRGGRNTPPIEWKSREGRAVCDV